VKGIASRVLRGAGHFGPAVTAIAGRAAVRARPGTALIVPVLAAEPAVAAWLGRERVDFDGVPLHCTVMFPFLLARSVGVAEEDAVAELARGIEPFVFALARLGRFPGVHYLAPEPAAPFVEVTERIQLLWPSCLPYGGAYNAVVPHVTVSFGDQPPADLAGLEQALPIAAQASELWLIEQTPHRWRTRRRFPFGRAHPAGFGDGTGAGARSAPG
jgi:2'-5' RNA ligase superfamily